MADDAPAAYDKVADAYSRVLDPAGTGLVDPVLRELIGDVAGRDLLSLACGQGQDARLLARLGATVTGVDLSEEMLRHARRHEGSAAQGITYVRGDARDLSAFADRSFDGVVCHMALMDIPDLALTIGSVARVLRPQGWFVFSIVHPCYPGHVEVVADYLRDHRYRKRVPRAWLPTHAFHRPLGNYIGELAQSGFCLERVTEVHHSDADNGGVPGLLYARAKNVTARP
jgi:ubiquinone/menaquinone biosynthesis C-methylase UbiE